MTDVPRTALDPTHARAIAVALATRHANLKPLPDLGPTPGDRLSELAELTSAVGVVEALSGRGDEADWLGKRVERARTTLHERADRLLARAGDGRIRRPVVALSLADVRFDAGGEAAFAPLETSDTGVDLDDIALEVASLSLSLALAGRADLSECLVSHYAGRTEDFDLYGVLDLYETLVLLRHLASHTAQEARALVARLMVAYSAPPTPRSRAFVVAMTGQVASGKSTLARALSDTLGAPLVNADRIRDHLVHGAPSRPLHEAGWASGFEPGFGPRVYTELLRHAEKVVETGRSVVLDACFATPVERAAARALALRHGLPFCFVECSVDPAVQLERLRTRDEETPGDDWEKISAALRERFVPATELPDDERWRVDTSQTSQRLFDGLVDSLLGSVNARGRRAAGSS